MKKPRTPTRANPPTKPLLIHVHDATRGPIIRALAILDDEAFSWLVLAIPPSAMLHGGTCQIWPDGLGGFQDRVTLEALRVAAQAWLDARQRS